MHYPQCVCVHVCLCMHVYIPSLSNQVYEGYRCMDLITVHTHCLVKIHPKMLHTLRPHTLFCLEMEYKIVRSPRLQGIRRCAPHALQSGTSNYYL